MSIMQSIRFRAEDVRSLAFGSISGTYAGIGTAITSPARQFVISNLTDADVMISFDGVNDHLPLMARTQFIDDVTSNKSIGGGWFLSEGTRVYVKEIGNPTSGSVYLSIFYGAD